jgi:uncharacterized protein
MQPLNILIKPVSGECNLNCSYCFYHDIMDNRSSRNFGKMTESTLEKLVEASFKASKQPINFTFQGGEPTLIGLEFYDKFITLVEQYNVFNIAVYYSIQTNGYVIDEAWAKFFKKHKFLVGLSIDGTKEIHDKYRKNFTLSGSHTAAIDAAKLFERFQVDYNVLTVVSKDITRQPEKVYEFLEKNGNGYLQFIPCLDEMNTKKVERYSLSALDYGKFLVALFDLWSSDIRNNKYISIRYFENIMNMMTGFPPESCVLQGRCSCNLVVEANGNLYPCDFYVLDEWFIGNINEMTIEEARKNKVVDRFIHESQGVHKKCKACQYYKLCHGGCKREHDSSGVTRLCAGYQYFFDQRLRKLAEVIEYLRSNRIV